MDVFDYNDAIICESNIHIFLNKILEINNTFNAFFLAIANFGNTPPNRHMCLVGLPALHVGKRILNLLSKDIIDHSTLNP